MTGEVEDRVAQLEEQVRQLQADLAFVVRYQALHERGSSTVSETGYAMEIAKRTERFSEQPRAAA